ncbi:MAG: hypothetical protein K8S56_08425 [Candidatus Cloacimonetes bacterium]|nr:hypothetical protein [Candidatus Cloacimonadota bacterium]
MGIDKPTSCSGSSKRDKKIVRYYLSPPPIRLVLESQLFNWLKYQNEAGLPSNCYVICYHGNPVKFSKEKREKLEQDIGGKIRYAYFYNKTLLIILQTILLGCQLWWKEHRRADKIIFQSRIPQVAFGFLLISFLPKVRVIYDARAAFPEAKRAKPPKGLLKRVNNSIRLGLQAYSEIMLFRKAHAVFAVSHRIKEFFAKEFKDCDRDRVYVIPGVADSKQFNYQPESGTDSRRKHGLENRIVITYAGGLRERWQIPEKNFQLFKTLYSLDDSYFFQVLSRDVELAEKMAQKFGLPDNSYDIRSVPHDEVNAYLNQADIALLLRDDDPTNHQASPTKFAEYALTGLPTIITKWIFDYAEITRKLDLGYVLDNLDFSDDNTIVIHKWILSCVKEPETRRATKERINKLAMKYLNKELFVELMRDVIISDEPVQTLTSWF